MGDLGRPCAAIEGRQNVGKDGRLRYRQFLQRESIPAHGRHKVYP